MKQTLPNAFAVLTVATVLVACGFEPPPDPRRIKSSCGAVVDEVVQNVYGEFYSGMRDSQGVVEKRIKHLAISLAPSLASAQKPCTLEYHARGPWVSVWQLAVTVDQKHLCIQEFNPFKRIKQSDLESYPWKEKLPDVDHGTKPPVYFLPLCFSHSGEFEGYLH